MNFKLFRSSFSPFRRLMLGFLLIWIVGLAACQAAPNIQAGTPPAEGQATPLPAPRLQGEMSFEEVLAKRRSVRSFTEQPLTLEEMGQLLWSAQGITDPRGFRTAPSAGALYPLEVYVVTEEGIYHYIPNGHQVTFQAAEGTKERLFKAALNQLSVKEAPAVFAITAVYERTAQKYGEKRSPQYVHLEAGHAAQNILLQAVAMGLGAVPIGAFYDEQVQEALNLPADHQPLYLIPVGHPR